MGLLHMLPALISSTLKLPGLITALSIRCLRWLRSLGFGLASMPSHPTSPNYRSEPSEDGEQTPNPSMGTQRSIYSTSHPAESAGSFSGVSLSLIWFSRVTPSYLLPEAQSPAPSSDSTPSACESSQAPTDSQPATNTTAAET